MKLAAAALLLLCSCATMPSPAPPAGSSAGTCVVDREYRDHKSDHDEYTYRRIACHTDIADVKIERHCYSHRSICWTEISARSGVISWSETQP